MSFAQLATDTFIKPIAWAAAPAAILVGGVRDGLVPLDYDEPRFAVHGRLLIDGEPVEGVEVRLHALPVEGLTPAPSAVTDSDGAFSLRTNAWQDGVAAGEYRATVVLRQQRLSGELITQGENILPAEYSRAATTPLRLTVRPRANSVEVWNISRCTCQG